MAKFKINDEGIDNTIENIKKTPEITIVENKPAAGRGTSEGSLKALEENRARRIEEAKTGKNVSPKTYTPVNIYGYEDYLKRISKRMNTTVAGYILDLIKADFQMNQVMYEKTLKDNPELDWVKHPSPNRKDK